MKKIVALVAVLLTASISPASAGPLMKYDYFDAAYEWTHVDGDAQDANGLDSKLSFSPIENFALEGGYNFADSGLNTFEFGKFDIDQHIYRYGGLGYYTWCPGIDLIARVGGMHVRYDTNIPGISDGSDNGVYAGVGVRYLFTDDIETNLDITWSRVTTGDWNYTGTAFYALAENVALKAGVGINDESDVNLFGGVRLAM
jgi:opacity protein-like surface antigen